MRSVEQKVVVEARHARTGEARSANTISELHEPVDHLFERTLGRRGVAHRMHFLDFAVEDEAHQIDGMDLLRDDRARTSDLRVASPSAVAASTGAAAKELRGSEID